MEKDLLKERVCQAIDEQAERIIDIGTYLLNNPELGFKEVKGAARVAKEFDQLGMEYKEGLALTGVKATLFGKSSGPTVAVIGELDALTCPAHPNADPQTGAAHVCGHNAQVAAMLGVAMGLVRSEAMTHLAGNVALFAVPAEEYVEIEFRTKLQQDGKLEFLGGKPEMIRLGEFDDVDIAMMVHAYAGTPDRKFIVGGTSNGCLVKTVQFQGKASHAGGSPDLGVNALNAAALGIMGIHSQRETFRDEETVRVHFILTSGGDMVNVVPDDVRMEMFVRGKSIESIEGINMKVNRALKGGAAMVGAEVKISDLPGYLPRLDEEIVSVALRQNASILLGAENVLPGEHRTGSTDMGDVSHLIPALHPYFGGIEGNSHSENFQIVDEEMAYVIPAKIMAMTVIDLLFGDAKLGTRAIQAYQPKFTKDEYLAYLRGITSDLESG
jgi:amidohydrolase